MSDQLTEKNIQPLRLGTSAHPCEKRVRILDDERARNARALYAQLKERPLTWGVGLWQNEETEMVAERCAEIFAENFIRCPNDYLIPQDRMCMIGALDDLGDLDGAEAVRQIEEELGCLIPEELFGDTITFEEFVGFLMKHRGKNPPKRHPVKDSLEGIFVLVFLAGVFIMLPFFFLYSACGDIRSMSASGLRWADVTVLVLKFIAAGALLFAVMKMLRSVVRSLRTK